MTVGLVWDFDGYCGVMFGMPLLPEGPPKSVMSR